MEWLFIGGLYAIIGLLLHLYGVAVLAFMGQINRRDVKWLVLGLIVCPVAWPIVLLSAINAEAKERRR